MLLRCDAHKLTVNKQKVGEKAERNFLW